MTGQDGRARGRRARNHGRHASVRRPGDATDRLLAAVLRAAAVTAGVVVVLIAGFLVLESLPALRRVGVSGLVTDDGWHPEAQRWNISAMLAGTLLCAAGAMVIAAPLGLATAVFLRHAAPTPLRTPLRRLVELMAGIPSVVYGFWGLVVIVPFIARVQPPGTSLLAASLILGMMVLPTVALTADAALGAVPADIRRGAAALGFSRWTQVLAVEVPAARGGLATGLLLALGRALGETMAVLMVAGNIVQVPGSVFEPVRTLTAGIALEMGYALELHRSVLFACGLVLLALVAALVLTAERVGGGLRTGERVRA